MSKSSMKIKQNYSSETGATRRSFLNKLWWALGFIALAEFIVVVYAYLRPAKSKPQAADTNTVIAAGSVDAFARNSMTAFVRGRFYLARLADGGFLALSRKCTHLGCTVPWVAEENKFACPCHASAFDITGNVISPPAPRALDFYAVTIENDRVTVDTSRALERSEFKAEQVVYAKKEA
jgi:cytochrome b6-f complex iron-sulfur subunit